MGPVVKENEEICWKMYLDHFGLDVDCSPSARLLVCVADCGSLFHCLQTNLTQLAYVILLKISFYLANEYLKPCFTSAFFGKFHEAKTSPEGLHIRGDSLNSGSN